MKIELNNCKGRLKNRQQRPELRESVRVRKLTSYNGPSDQRCKIIRVKGFVVFNLTEVSLWR